MTDSPRARQGYAASNLECAGIIAADPIRYPGMMQTWAVLVLQRAEPTIKGPLFKAAQASTLESMR